MKLNLTAEQKIYIEPVFDSFKLVIANGNRSVAFVLETEKEAKKWKKDFVAFLKNDIPFETMYQHAEEMYQKYQAGVR